MTHQVEGVRESTIVAIFCAVTAAPGLILGQDLAEVGDIAGGKSQRVQLGQFSVWRHPGQCRLQLDERLAQYSHAVPFASIGRVPLDEGDF